jgi:ribosomal protein L40E
MEQEIGIVCGRCDRYSPMGTKVCTCGHDLSLYPYASSSPSVPGLKSVAQVEPLSFDDDDAPPTDRSPTPFPGMAKEVLASASEAVAPPVAIDYAQLSQEELMELARNYVCRSCSAGVPVGHKFCGRCGAAVPPEILNARTQFFGQMQDPKAAKLVLIRGEGMEGMVYHLRGTEHVVGTQSPLQLLNDPFVSAKHANFLYRNDKLFVRDEGSRNGVYIRIRGTVEVALNEQFLAGEQVFLIEGNAVTADTPASDGTYFYSSPKHPGPFKIVQVFQGGAHGMTVCARGSSLQIGREGGDLNFPGDPYMSGTHCRIEESAGKLLLTDLNSRNGTYVRVKGELELSHGDYLFIGRKLMRVELNSN